MIKLGIRKEQQEYFGPLGCDSLAHSRVLSAGGASLLQESHEIAPPLTHTAINIWIIAIRYQVEPSSTVIIGIRRARQTKWSTIHFRSRTPRIQMGRNFFR